MEVNVGDCFSNTDGENVIEIVSVSNTVVYILLLGYNHRPYRVTKAILNGKTKLTPEQTTLYKLGL